MANNITSESFDHAVDTLRFDATLELIAARCVNESARKAIRSLRPAANRAAIVTSLELIEEFRARCDEHGDVSMADVDYREAVEHLVERGEPLEALELLRVASGERIAAELQRQLAIDPHAFPRLTTLANDVTPHGEIVSAIGRAIDDDGNVKDDASPELASIRRRMHRARRGLRDRSEKMSAAYGTDSYPTVLGSRYVLLVPRAQFHKGDGLVHSRSHRGGSVYFEPFDMVERNNELETLAIDEATEVARILRELSDRIRAVGAEVLANADTMIETDALRAKSAFAREFSCVSPEPAPSPVPLGEPSVTAERDRSDTGKMQLVAARHPLLVRSLEASGRAVVPLDLQLSPGERAMVITGPNAGGKTVALKTLGTSVLLFQSGIQVPCAEGTTLPVFDRLMVDIGDEQSIETSLSTFTSHLRHLDEMCRLADERTLCLIDEIGDGTDPDEGAALAVATLEALLDGGAAVVATTHYGRIKTFALKADGVANASMAFEDTRGQPLYRLLQGVAGRSRGLETARRTGFSPEVLKTAEGYLGADAFRLEAVLNDLESTHLSLERERERLARQSAALGEVIDRYTSRAAEFDVSKQEADKRAGRQAEEFLSNTRREIEAIVKEIRESQAKREVLQKTRVKLDELLELARERRKPPPPAMPPAASVRAGDRVALNPSGEPAGYVIAVENGMATVEINDKRIKLDVGTLYKAPLEGKRPPNGVTFDVQVEPLSSTSLDVRGSRREEALEAVNRFVDRAVLSGVQELEIIHGVGEGILARAIREALESDRRVESIRPGGPGEGGVGATIVTLR